jgi:hypothetical protein
MTGCFIFGADRPGILPLFVIRAGTKGKEG